MTNVLTKLFTPYFITYSYTRSNVTHEGCNCYPSFLLKFPEVFTDNPCRLHGGYMDHSPPASPILSFSGNIMHWLMNKSSVIFGVAMTDAIDADIYFELFEITIM